VKKFVALVLFFSIIAVLQLSAQRGLADFQLKGRVREVSQSSCYPDSDASYLYIFSPEGLIREEKTVFSNNDYNRFLYAYDGEGRLLEKSTFYDSLNPANIEQHSYLDDGGLETRFFALDNNNDQYLTLEIIINSKGEVSRQKSYSAPRKLSSEFSMVIEGDEKIHRITNYDYKGKRNIFTEVRYSTDGKLLSQLQRQFQASNMWWWSYEYDSGGRIDRVVFIHKIDGKTVKDNSWTYTYDGDAENPISVIKADGEKMVLESRRFFYNGDVPAREEVDVYEPERGELSFSRLYIYDEKGKIVRMEYRFHPAESVFTRENSYAAGGETARSFLFNDAGFPLEGTVQEFNSKGLALKKETIGRYPQIETFEYDSEGRQIVSALLDGEGGVLSKTEWIYNGEFLIEERYYGNAGQLQRSTRHERVYDDYGNWTVWKTYFTNNLGEEYDRLQKHLIRTISYYP
jgi:hypothetical protein